jgi:hypothetical protein
MSIRILDPNNLDWPPGHLCRYVVIRNYRINQISDGVHTSYMVIQLDQNHVPITRVGLFYDLDEALAVIKHDQKVEV